MIPFHIPLEIIDTNEHKDGGLNFYIGYVGPLGGSGSQKKVKVDIARSEQLSFDPANKPVILGYSDQENHQLLCYTLEEVLIEKLRSVMQRMQARDFYDIWYLLETQNIDVEYLTKEFQEKCLSKELNPENFRNKLNQRLPQYKKLWEKSISDQIHNLPDFLQVEREALRKLKNFL